MVKSIGIYKNPQIYATAPTANPAMRGTTNTLERTPEQDVVIAKTHKKQMSTASKIALGIGGTLAGVIGACILISRHETKALKKLYNEKLVLSNLPEKLEFKEAKTIEEGIRFAKETLKIPEVDEKFTLEALNITNRGLVDVSNAYKGKVFMPRALRWRSVGDDYIAAVVRDVKSDFFGDLRINSDMFKPEILNKDLKEVLYNEGKQVYPLTEGKALLYNNIAVIPDKKLESLIKKFYENPENLSISDKQNLYYSLSNIKNRVHLPDRAPKHFLEIVEKSKAYENYLKEGGEKIDYSKLTDLKTENQAEYVQTILNKMAESKNAYKETFSTHDPATTIYHEMGHLQDFAENLKKLDIMNWDFNLGKIWKESWANAKNGLKHENKASIKQVENRWGALYKKGYQGLLKKDPEKFKMYYPDLYEFLTNQGIQQTAGKVSGYAQVGIGEFVAECHANIIAGKKLPDDVIALYKKYNGPGIDILK